MAIKKNENSATAINAKPDVVTETTRTKGEPVFVTGLTTEPAKPDITQLRRKLQMDAVNWQVYLARQNPGSLATLTEEDVAAMLLIHEAAGIDLTHPAGRTVTLNRMKELIQLLEVTPNAQQTI